jgi:hypothetical protein
VVPRRPSINGCRAPWTERLLTCWFFHSNASFPEVRQATREGVQARRRRLTRDGKCIKRCRDQAALIECCHLCRRTTIIGLLQFVSFESSVWRKMVKNRCATITAIKHCEESCAFAEYRITDVDRSILLKPRSEKNAPLHQDFNYRARGLPSQFRNTRQAPPAL